jgi:outer membrane receptor protein involved in Fe transport
LALRKNRKFSLLASTILVASVAVPATADAQERIRERVNTDRVLNTVEVTAQKRSENLQDVPIAIQTFDAEQLATFRIDGFDDLQTFTPGLTASPNPADSSGLRLSIRGIGQDDPQIGLDATVGLYVNGVYIGKTPGLSFDTPDLERVEVLKGPQGTLYGRNAVAGAINIITKGAEIGEGFTGNSTLEFGNFGQFGFKGAVNIPLGETAAIKLSGLTFERDGYVENVPTQFALSSLDPVNIPAAAGFLPQGQGTDFGGVDRQGFNLDLAWQPTPQLLIEYGFDTSQSLNEPFFQQLVPNEDGGFGAFQAGSLAAGVPLVPVTEGFQREAVSTVPIEETRSDVIGHRISANWDWNENHSTKILGAFRRADVDAFTSFFPELNPFVLGGTLDAGTADPTAPADPLTNPSLLDLLGTVLPGLLANIDPLLPATDLTVRPDFATAFNTPFDPPFLSGPFASFGTGTVDGIPTLDNHEQFSIELTQTGSFGDRIQYTGGLFYFDEDTAAGNFNDRPGDALGIAQLLPSLALLPQIQGVLEGPAGDPANGLIGTGAQLQAVGAALQDPATPPAALPGLQAQLAALQAQLAGLTGQLDDLAGDTGLAAILSAARSPGARLELDTQAFAAYGEVTVQLTDQFSITGGLRYSRDKKEAFQQGVSPFFNDTVDLLGNTIPALTGDETFDSLDPKVVIEYTPTDDLLLYASYSQAFRSGGFNQASVNLSDFVFDEERIRSGEIGIKSDWFNDRIRLNANVFASFVDDQQFTFTNPAVPVARFIENNDAEFIGFEVDGQFVVGDYLTASFSYAFLDAEADEFINPFTGAIAGGVDNAPRNSYAVNLDYVRPVGIGDLAAHIGFNHKDATTVIGVPRTNSNLLDARLGYTFGGDNGRSVTVFAYGQNLTDDEFTIDGLDVLSAVIGTTNVFGQPRTYGGGISVTF